MDMVTNIKQLHEIQAKALTNIQNYEAELLLRTKLNLSMQLTAEQLRARPFDLNNLSQNSLDELMIEKCNFIWKPFNYYDRETQRKIDRRLLRQNNTTNPLVLNHFESLKQIATKSGLIRSLHHYYYTNQQAKAQGYNEFDSTPTTFLVQSRVHDDRMSEFIQRFKQIQKGYAPKERLPMKHCIQNIWLVKPTNMN